MFTDRGRGSSLNRRFGKPFQNNKPFGHQEVARPPSPPVGDLLDTLSVDKTLKNPSDRIDGKDISITNCECIASFSWLHGKEPGILVPGSPPAWTPPARHVQLQQDSGDYFRDPNAARCPSHPMVPSVQAVLAQNPDIDCQEIDIFACTSTLGSLLRFARRRVDKPFRFWVEVVGNTAFFVRHENSPKDLIPDVRGFGHTFPEAYTTWDVNVKGSVSHQRLLRYDLAGLKCVVRFQCDGYLKDKAACTSAEVMASDSSSEDIFEETLNSLVLKEPSCETNKDITTLQIKRGGRDVPQGAIFELKTRSGLRQGLNVLEEEIPRFWLAQIPNFILAYHTRGSFETPEPQDVRSGVEKWEQESQEDISVFRRLLDEIISAVKARGDGKLEICCKDLSILELRQQGSDEHAVLPHNLRTRWMMGGDEGVSESEESETASVAATVDFSDDDSDKDYTACGMDCDYCGRCSY